MKTFLNTLIGFHGIFTLAIIWNTFYTFSMGDMGYGFYYLLLAIINAVVLAYNIICYNKGFSKKEAKKNEENL